MQLINHMSIATIESTNPKVHSKTIQNELGDLIQQVRVEIDQVEEPRFQALLETTAEVLIGLQTAFRDYNLGTEKAWKI